MKKMFVLSVLVLVTAMAFSACGKKPAEINEPNEQGSSVETQGTTEGDTSSEQKEQNILPASDAADISEFFEGNVNEFVEGRKSEIEDAMRESLAEDSNFTGDVENIEFIYNSITVMSENEAWVLYYVKNKGETTLLTNMIVQVSKNESGKFEILSSIQLPGSQE